ncbi:serpin [Raccoonpox virus]|uniref:Serpin n=1 Tax=Raccoon poxvirus TaxID=10256 RepID=A0A0G3G2T8_RACVI|nr:Serpin [Raccoonpox virus]AKJ93827.1 Serpin [Raccoonpox virus]AOP31462.1 serpin [Raccoonpox virus]
MDIFRELILERDNDNILISPVSILSTLSLLYHGAAGSTADQISKYIEENTIDISNYDTMEVDDTECSNLVVANKIYGSDNIVFYDTFIQKIRDDFRSVNFNDANKTRDIINEWAKTVTDGKIDPLLTNKLPINTLITTVNVVHFKAKWKYPFSKNSTYTDIFYMSNDSSTNVNMMVSTDNDLPYVHIDESFGGFSMVDIPYEGNSSMLIILPDDIKGLYNIERNLTNENFKKWCNKLSTTSIDLYMPKFKIEMLEPYNLIPILNKLGLNNIVGNYSDFSKMCKEPVTIDSFLHKSFIDVNEEYTEAAAATCICITNFSMVYSKKVYVNHPFMYMIKDNSGRILFIGRYCYPR